MGCQDKTQLCTCKTLCSLWSAEMPASSSSYPRRPAAELLPQLMDRDESLPGKPRPAQAFVKDSDHVIDGSICWHLPGHYRKQQWAHLWQGWPRLYSSYRGYDQVMGTLKILQPYWSFDEQVLGFNEYFHTWETLKIRTLFKLESESLEA